MDEKQLTIEQVGKIMGWSYQTALKFANRHGEMVGRKWYVPATAVSDEITKVNKTLERMNLEFIRVVTMPEELVSA